MSKRALTGIKGLEDLDEIKDVSLQDILINLLDGDTDLELKTQIFNPKDLAGLQTISVVLKMDELPNSSKLIKDFIKVYLRYMVSYQRKSREEIINAISGLLNREQVKMTLSEKMTKEVK